MGAMNRDAVMTTVDNAIKMWNPRGIIMVGVAWGMNKGKQRIGEVLISKKYFSMKPQKYQMEVQYQEALIQKLGEY
mgnify:FL=1|jgi:nucleoside phosphorylase